MTDGHSKDRKIAGSGCWVFFGQDRAVWRRWTHARSAFEAVCDVLATIRASCVADCDMDAFAGAWIAASPESNTNKASKWRRIMTYCI